MNLKQLKLAGFKSFVDPTTIPFPSQLVGVVGPNGCGKSNVIDAVRWVMGESSAKNLRGESMADVIFNGSSTRKTVGQASVELVFDNSMGRLTGQYASYQEISVKRIVTRDGDSSYFLNGTRCRRRDITDIFLGTGAGTRGYSIIGQGTISRIVEARPEELRVFLEEAAGVSKYKERRRETLTRITHTRDNLARIADIRDELNNQLQRLERQAKAAERYQVLKAEERACKADILALKWQAFQEEQTTLEQAMNENSLCYEQHQAQIVNAQKISLELREKHQDSNTQYQESQAHFYQLAADIARLEESVQQQQREKQRLQNERQQVQADWQILTNQLQQDRDLRQASEETLSQLLLRQEALNQELAQKQQSFETISDQHKIWQEQLDQSQAMLANAARDEQVAQVRLNHLIQGRQDISLRLEKIQDEMSQLEETLAQVNPVDHQASLLHCQDELAQEEESYQAFVSKGEALRAQITETETCLNQQQDKYRQLHVEQATLSASIQAALKQDTDVEGNSFLDANSSRLIDMMSVEDTWQSACEFVMGITLQAVVVDTLESLWPEWPSLVKSACMITTNKQARLNKGSYPRLSDKIQGIVPSFVLDLDKIYTASSVDEARDWLPFIQEDESIITPDCCWFSKGWVRTPGVSTQEHQSLLAKQQELKRISQSLISVEDELSHLKLKRDELREMLQANSHQVSSTQQQLADWREKIRNCEAEIRNQERIAQQHLNNKGRLSEEYDTLHSRLEDLVTQQANVENKAQEAVELRQQYEEKKQQILIEKSTLENTLSEQRQTLDEARTAAHQLALEREREQLIVSQLTKNITRDQDRLDGVSERMEAVAEQLLAVETPDVSLGDSLNEKLSRHAEMEEHLNASREQLASLLQEIETQEARIREEEKQAKAIQDRIQQQQLQRQTVLVHADNLVEGLHELGAQPDSLLRVMPSGTTTALREQDLQSLVDRIKRLGAINLAAIEEYETEKQRKQYLDEQYQDLTEALQTLDAAIEKMDKETTQRLQQTFDEVNRAFQSLFPRLFGGGRAMLELTCDNLLEAGVIVMAQPPGKRNSTIHLLSGGEKAMTAVALVFAIFQLNPSPFCMLDEVDAPLDDVNVGRFCTLVKEMSQFVQFLFITHNKITMELADHLIGVTMREPGVSRVVSVDVEQALAMTEL